MKKYQLFFFIISLLFLGEACKNDIPITSLDELQDQLSPIEEVHMIDPSIPNRIITKKGTIIFLPQNSFDSQNGKNVEVKVREFKLLSEILSSSLSTMSGDEILKTAGMIHLSASQEGRELSIEENKTVIISFLKENEEEEYELFYGNEDLSGRINWIPNEIVSIRRYGIDSVDEKHLSDSSLYKPLLEVVGYTIYGAFHEEDWRQIIDSIDHNLNSHLALSAEINTKIDSIDSPIGLDFDFRSNGRIKKINFSPSLSESIKNELSEVFYILEKKILLYPFHFYSEKSYMTISIEKVLHFDSTGYEKRFIEKYSAYKKEAIEYMDEDEFEYFILSTSKLGWVNCDIFFDYKGEKKDIVVPSFPDDNVKLLMVFADNRSVIEGTEKDNLGNTIFRGIPEGIDVKVLGYSFLDSKPTLSLTTANTMNDTIPLSPFTSFSLQEFVEKVNSL